MDVFDRCVEKVDGSLIKENRLLKVLIYPVMVYFHFYMVKNNRNNNENVSITDFTVALFILVPQA